MTKRQEQGSAGFGSTDDLNRVAEKYAVRITPSVYDTMEFQNPNDPVARQYIPDAKELSNTEEEISDPIGDNTHSPTTGIVHRYPDRVLLMPVSSCAVYCRYCFRREKVGQGKGHLSEAKLEKALSYIENTPEIWEVILSGGDPLILSPRRLKKIIQRLEDIDHVQVIRIHSRVPIADPDRIDNALCNSLETTKALYIAIHVNHVQEISEEVKSSLEKLRNTDAVLISQSVFLKGVNNRAETLEALFRKLVSLRIKPYYLHHPDKAKGTDHFRISLKEGQDIMRALRGRLSGLCLPNYMLDIPGGYGKVPVTPSYLTHQHDNLYTVEDYQGDDHLYRV